MDLLEQFVVESSDSLVSLDDTIAAALKNWLDDQILQEWISGSTILQEINNVLSEQLKQTRYYFQVVDPRAVVLINQMQNDWKGTVNAVKDDILVCFVLFILVPVAGLIYFITLLEFFDRPFMDTLSLLEILDVGFGIRGGDYLTYRNVVELLAKTYTDDNFKQVIGAIRYKYSTIVKLNELLNRLNINNYCLDFDML